MFLKPNLWLKLHVSFHIILKSFIKAQKNIFPFNILLSYCQKSVGFFSVSKIYLHIWSSSNYLKENWTKQIVWLNGKQILTTIYVYLFLIVSTCKHTLILIRPGAIKCDDLRKKKLVKFLIDAKISKCCLFEKQSTQRPFFVA